MYYGFEGAMTAFKDCVAAVGKMIKYDPLSVEVDFIVKQVEAIPKNSHPAVCKEAVQLIIRFAQRLQEIEDSIDYVPLLEKAMNRWKESLTVYPGHKVTAIKIAEEEYSIPAWVEKLKARSNIASLEAVDFNTRFPTCSDGRESSALQSATPSPGSSSSCSMR